jgi:transcriptional regulator with XRE-family HTH domain
MSIITGKYMLKVDLLMEKENHKNRLKIIRIMEGLTKVDLSRLAKISVSTITNIEDKNHIPTEVTMQRIVNALNLHSGKSYEVKQIFG